MNKVLITGGSGFIGTNLCCELLKKNFDITILDKVEPRYSFDSSQKIAKYFCADR